jgi:hypothetical protein
MQIVDEQKGHSVLLWLNTQRFARNDDLIQLTTSNEAATKIHARGFLTRNYFHFVIKVAKSEVDNQFPVSV